MSIATITESNETKYIYNASFRKRALIVEDNKIIGKILKHNFNNLGYDCDIAESGKEGLKLLNPMHSLIFLDIGLPDISGWHVARQIKLFFDAPLCNIPIIMNSAHFPEEKIDKNKEFIDGFIEKPINQKQLTLILSKALKNK
jgi:CheY-like chemotaxis protein